MTLEEMLAREAIRHTLASYNVSGDRARIDELTEQFTEDGILELPDGSSHQGRDAIKASMTRVASGPRDETRPPIRFVRHNITTSQIEFTGPDTASGRTYWFVLTNAGPDHSGYYADTFRKVGDRWLIAHRKARLDWASPDSLMASPPPGR